MASAASSASSVPGSVPVPSSALSTCDPAPRRDKEARVLTAVNWSLAEAGQASTSRSARPGKSSASRTAAAHPKDPPATVTGPAPAGIADGSSAAR